MNDKTKSQPFSLPNQKKNSKNNIILTGLSKGEIKDCNSLPTNADSDVDHRRTEGMSNAFGSMFGTNMINETLPICSQVHKKMLNCGRTSDFQI